MGDNPVAAAQVPANPLYNNVSYGDFAAPDATCPVRRDTLPRARRRRRCLVDSNPARSVRGGTGMTAGRSPISIVSGRYANIIKD